MLEWVIRWGIPLALIATYVLMASPAGHSPSAAAQHAIDAFRDALLGLIPRFF